MKRSFAAALVIRAIRLYRNTLSCNMLPSCRFLPSCSIYAQEAIETYGLSTGLWMTAKRLLRCHPLCHGGADPVQ